MVPITTNPDDENEIPNVTIAASPTESKYISPPRTYPIYMKYRRIQVRFLFYRVFLEICSLLLYSMACLFCKNLLYL